MTVEDAVLEKLKILRVDRKQEVLDFAEFLEQKDAGNRPRRSLKGIWAGMGVNITEEDIQEARNEMWRGYTKDTEDYSKY